VLKALDEQQKLEKRAARFNPNPSTLGGAAGQQQEETE